MRQPQLADFLSMPDSGTDFLTDSKRRTQAAICFCCIVYTYFRIPEPNGRTFAELDVLFEKGVSARKFASTKVDVFHEVVEAKVMNQYETIIEPTAEKAHLHA